MNLKKIFFLLCDFICKGLRKQRPLQNKCRDLTQEHWTTHGDLRKHVGTAPQNISSIESMDFYRGVAFKPPPPFANIEPQPIFPFHFVNDLDSMDFAEAKLFFFFFGS